MKAILALVGLIACAAPAAPRTQPAAAPVVGCPSPPDVNLEACHDTMACPDPPDLRVRACRTDEQTRQPQLGRILKVEVVGATRVLTIGLGTKQGVRAGWVGEVLDGSTDTALPGGTLELVRIEPHQTLARSTLPLNHLTANPHVRLQPPP